MITNKERARRFVVRLKTLFDIPDYDTYKSNGKTKRWKKFYFNNIPVKIPNFWYTPFEVYVLAHLQRAHFIMTCNEWAYVNASVEYARYFKRSSYQQQRQNEWEIEEFEKRLDEFKERIKKKDENTNTQTESDN